MYSDRLRSYTMIYFARVLWMINRRLFILYFCGLLLLAPFLLLHFDSFYYWDWSRHPALSYYDGSPMIAWLIRPSTALFGDNLFALSFVGIASTAASSFFLYKTARMFLQQEASFIALALWLFSPLVTMDMLKATTYNNPLTLFWIVTLYSVVRYLKSERNQDLYLIGLSAGLLLLSKYTGVVLLLGLFVFLITSQYRRLFKNPHFYAALLIALAVFSPVLIWNYQHQWLSFLYQLNIHKDTSLHNPLISMLNSFGHRFISALNLMLLPPLICCFLKFDMGKPDPEKSFFLLIRRLCLIICSVFLCFYLYVASNNKILPSWLACYLITSALLAACLYQQGYLRSAIRFTVGLYLVCSALILIYNTTFFSTEVIMNPRFSHFFDKDSRDQAAQEISAEGLKRMQANYSDRELIEYIKNSKGNLETHKEFKKYISYVLIQKLNEAWPNLPKDIYTSGWLEARKFFFLNNKPNIFALGCGSLINQYAFWSREAIEKIKSGKTKEIVFIDQIDQSRCLQQYFSHCQRMPVSSLEYNNEQYSLFMYKCDNEGQAAAAS